MRKLMAFIICGLAALLAGYTLLPQGFNSLVEWLGPVFGLPLVFVLSSLFILVADPIRFPVVAILWAAIGIVGGMIIRKRIGSVLTMISVFSVQFSILSLSAFGLFDVVQKYGILGNPGNILNILPPVPQGASMSSILSAPIVSDILAQMQGVSLQSLDQGTIVNMLLNSVIFSIVKNLVILSIAALAGCELGKLVLRPFLPRIEAFRTSHMPVATAMRRPLSASLILLVLLCSVGIAVPAKAFSGIYSETILATVTPNGAGVASALLVDTSNILKEIDLSNSAFENSIGALMIAQQLDLPSIRNDLTFLTKQMQISGMNLDEILRFYQLVPSTMLVVVYRADRISEEAAESQANAAAELFGKKFGTSFTSFIPAGGLPIGDAPVRVFPFQSSLSFSDAVEKMVGELPESTRGGLARYLGRVYRSGVLTPGRTSRSANGTLLVTGFINPEVVRDTGENSPLGPIAPLTSSLKTKIPFFGLGCFFAGRFHSSPIVVHELNVADLLGAADELTFSTSSNASSIITIVPTGNTTLPGQYSSPIINIGTSLESSALEEVVSFLQNSFGLTEGQQSPITLSISNFPPGTVIDPDALGLIFTQRFPLQLRVSKSASMSQVERGQTVNVTVTVFNDDSEAAEDVHVDDSIWQRFYPAAELSSGVVTADYPYVNGSSSVSFSYLIRLKELGTYTFPVAVVAYTYKGEQYFSPSNTLALQVPRPGILNVLSEGAVLGWNTAVNLLNLVPPIGGNGSTILMVMVVAMVALVAFTQYRGYRKWLRGPAEKK